MQVDLKTLSDGELVAAADKAWQQSDKEGAAAIKAERARRQEQAKVTDKADRMVYRAGIAAAVVTAGAFIYVFTSFLQNHRVIDLILFIVPVLFGLLTYAVFKGNRAAIVTFAIFYLANIAFALFENPKVTPVGIFEVIIVYFLLKGVQGAFEHHKLQKNSQNLPG
jgi:hypothetical protein